MPQYKTQKGMALVMSLLLVPIFMMLIMSFINPIVRSYRAAVVDHKTLLARNVGKNLVEEALWASRDSGVGETISGTLEEEYLFGDAKGEWRVIGTPETDTDHTFSGEYTVPAAGSGNAGGDYCDTLFPVVDDVEQAQYDLGVIADVSSPIITDPLEWPCHWNKLYEGDVIEIPLYAQQGDEILNPGFTYNKSTGLTTAGGLGLSQFDLRVRAACDSGNPSVAARLEPYNTQICAPTERFDLQGDHPIDPALTTIVLWGISAEGLNDGGLVEENIQLSPYWNLNPIQNSNILSGKINLYETGEIFWLTEGNKNVDQNGIDNSNITTPLDKLHKPVLRLMVVHSLRKDGDTSTIVPYLEYQFKSPVSNMAISNVAKVIRVDVDVSGGYTETIEKRIDVPRAVSGFAIQQ